MSPEVNHRHKAHARASGPLKKVLNKRVFTSTKTKVVFADSLATSALFYNAQTWNVVTKSDMAKESLALAKSYRNAALLQLTKENGQFKQVSNSKVFLEAVRLDAEEQLVLIRLSAIPRMVKHAPSALLLLWDQALCADTDAKLLFDKDTAGYAFFFPMISYRLLTILVLGQY